MAELEGPRSLIEKLFPDGDINVSLKEHDRVVELNYRRGRAEGILVGAVAVLATLVSGFFVMEVWRW